MDPAPPATRRFPTASLATGIACALAGVAVFALAHPGVPREGHGAGLILHESTARATWALLLVAPILAFVAGIVSPRHWWVWPACAIVVLPGAIVVDGLSVRGSHNLVPFELAIYAFLALPALGAAYLGAGLRRREGSAGAGDASR